MRAKSPGHGPFDYQNNLGIIAGVANELAAVDQRTLNRLLRPYAFRSTAALDDPKFTASTTRKIGGANYCHASGRSARVVMKGTGWSLGVRYMPSTAVNALVRGKRISCPVSHPLGGGGCQLLS